MIIENIEEVREEITKNWDNSEFSGKLVQKYFVIWHYGIALSAKKLISLGAKTASLHGTCYLHIESLTPDFKEAKNVQYIDKCKILNNLLRSPAAFHGKWDYCLRGWNCEHWARLVTTGDPISYQVSEALFGISILLGGHFRNPDAKRVLAIPDHLPANG